VIGDLVKRLGKARLGWKKPGAGRVFDAVCLNEVLQFEMKLDKPIASGEEAFPGQNL